VEPQPLPEPRFQAKYKLGISNAPAGTMNSHPARVWIIRTSLILAILGGLATIGLTVIQVKHKITNLQSDLAAQTAGRQKAETELASTKAALATIAATLKETRGTLEVTAQEKQAALATAAAQTERAEKLTRDLSNTRQERDDAQANLARYRAAGLEPEQVLFAAGEIKSLKHSLAAAEEKIKGLELKVKRLASFGQEPREPVPLPAGLKAKVIATDPKWYFLVLDAGENQGVLERGELLVSRQGKLVARAKVSRVQSDRSIANLMPGWECGEVIEGDVAIPADPRL
jgi:hypothetical protein